MMSKKYKIQIYLSLIPMIGAVIIMLFGVIDMVRVKKKYAFIFYFLYIIPLLVFVYIAGTISSVFFISQITDDYFIAPLLSIFFIFWAFLSLGSLCGVLIQKVMSNKISELSKDEPNNTVHNSHNNENNSEDGAKKV